MKKTVVDEMVAAIAGDIFRGTYKPGEKLPPYRKLAATFGVTLPTAQRAVGRVDELGLVSVLHGSGATVLDPAISAHPGVLPYWVDAVLDEPGRAREIVEDFLEVRRELAGLLVSKLAGANVSGVAEAVNDFEVAMAAGAGIDSLLQADLAVVRAMLAAAPSIALASVFNAFCALLETITPLAEAMYAEPALNLAGYRGLLMLVGRADHDTLRAAIPATLAPLDAATANRFQRILEEQCLVS